MSNPSRFSGSVPGADRRDDQVHEGGRRWERPPILRVVRSSAPPPPLARAPVAIRLQVTPRRRRDGVGFAAGVVASMFAGIVLIAVAMGWIK
jgi:hypothetical protein